MAAVLLQEAARTHGVHQPFNDITGDRDKCVQLFMDAGYEQVVAEVKQYHEYLDVKKVQTMFDYSVASPAANVLQHLQATDPAKLARIRLTYLNLCVQRAEDGLLYNDKTTIYVKAQSPKSGGKGTRKGGRRLSLAACFARGSAAVA